MSLPILFQNDDFVAIDKPSGLLVHRTKIAHGVTESALQQLRDQIGHEVHPCHRLDRPTSGVLLFALSRDALRHAREQFELGTVQKHYVAVVRGWPPSATRIDSPLKLEDGSERVQDALTHVKTLATSEIEKPVSRYKSARFGCLNIVPLTGRTHQIRRHLAHIRHPIIGDSRHGDGAQNRFAREQLDASGLMLRANYLQIKLTESDETTDIHADLDECFAKKLDAFGLNPKKLHSQIREHAELSHSTNRV